MSHYKNAYKDVKHKEVAKSKQKEVIDDDIVKLLDDSMRTLDEVEDKVTLEEDNDLSLENVCGKMYRHTCKTCGFKSEANRKYTVLQAKLKHIETCCPNKMKKTPKSIKREECDCVIKDSVNMRCGGQ